MTFDYLIVRYNPNTNWAIVTYKTASFTHPLERNSGLEWIGQEGWELVGSIPLSNVPEAYLIFKKGVAKGDTHA